MEQIGVNEIFLSVVAKIDRLVKTQILHHPVIPAQAGDSVDFDPIISTRSGFPPTRE